MSAASSAHVDIRNFLQAQSRERYRGFVVHGPPLSGKTIFARKLTEQVKGGAYLDAMQYVADSTRWAKSIDQTDARAFGDLTIAVAREKEAALLLVDEIDFLVPVWGNDLSELLEMIRRLSVSATPATIGFVLQTRPSLEKWSLPSAAGHSRVLRLDDIRAL